MSFKDDKKTKKIIKSHSHDDNKSMFSPEESFKIYDEINEKMKNLRRDYKRRDKSSQTAASQIVLTS
jgi:hypothetical protein